MRVGLKANVYEEIVLEFKKMIDLGVLKQGDKLPSVRTYAVERKVNPNTVAKAYACLEEEGVIQVLPKKGAYVGARAKVLKESEFLKAQIQTIKDQGISKQDLLKVIAQIYCEEKQDD